MEDRLLPDIPRDFLNLLVLVDAMWVPWGPLHLDAGRDASWNRHDRFLRHLFDAAGNSSENGADSIDGWLLHDPEDSMPERLKRASGPVGRSVEHFYADFRTRPAVADARPSEVRDAPGNRKWLTGESGHAVLGRMIADLRLANEFAMRTDPPSRMIIEALLNLQGCRIYLAGDRVRRILHADDRDRCEVPGYACVDLRFRYSIGFTYLSTTLSLWSNRPASASHAPPDIDAEPTRRVDFDLLPARDSFYNLLKASFEEWRPTVFSAPYRPPQFWVIGGDGLSRALTPLTGAERPDDDRALLGHVHRRLLRTPNAHAEGVAHGRIEQVPSRAHDGDRLLTLHVARRFDRGRGASRYVLAAADGPLDQRERAVREFVYTATGLETTIAVEMYDISTDLDISSVLIKSYLDEGLAAGNLWDELSMHALAARGAQLNLIHQRAELMHQVLLQGTADLQGVQTRVGELAAHLDEKLVEFEEFFDRHLVELGGPGADTVRSSLLSGGLIERTRQATARAGADARRAMEAYQSLLNSITYAFDERRVRVTDRLGPIALVAAVALAVVPFVTELWAAMVSREDAPQWLVRVALPLGVAGLAAASVGTFFYFRRRFGSLRVSRRFRTQYQDLLQYLRNTRTERLNDLRTEQRDTVTRAVVVPPGRPGPPEQQERTAREREARMNGAWKSYYRVWDAEDERLAAACAVQLDRVREDPSGSRPRWWKRLETLVLPQRTVQLRDLGDRVERWALRALFVTERPREIYRFPLPRLILLYAAVAFWFGIPTTSSRRAMIADSELAIALRLHYRATPEETAEISHWIRRVAYDMGNDGRSAAELLQRIADAGARLDTDRRPAEVILERIREERGGTPPG